MTLLVKIVLLAQHHFDGKSNKNKLVWEHVTENWNKEMDNNKFHAGDQRGVKALQTKCVLPPPVCCVPTF